MGGGAREGRRRRRGRSERGSLREREKGGCMVYVGLRGRFGIVWNFFIIRSPEAVLIFPVTGRFFWMKAGAAN